MGLKGTFGALIVLGLAIIVASVMFIEGVTTVIYSGLGLSLILAAGIALIFSNLYVKSAGNLAYFKTGRGGPQVIKDTGRVVIPFLHEIIPVSLETMKLVVERKGKDSLITSDKLRAEVVAEFYIRVKADDDGIRTAARTLGKKISSAAGAKAGKFSESDLLKEQISVVQNLEKEKLIDALRTVAATKSLNELNLKRAEFKKSVMDAVKDGLEQNGLELEDCTISSLDQAPKEIMDPNNSFDAEGLKNLQKVISEASIEENKFKRDAELAIKQRDVATRKAVLSEEQDQKFAEAEQQRQVQVNASEQATQAAMVKIQNDEEVGKRDITKTRVLELEAVEKDRNVEMANVEKTKAIETAAVQKEQAVEVAFKQREITVAEKDAERAKAQETRNIAETEAEKAKQLIETVTVTATAQREKEKAIIAKQAVIEQTKQEEQMKADVQAYTTQKEAEGRKLAAEADYNAKIKAAEAAQKSMEMNATGQRAEQMVPVEVAKQQVEVERAKVEVARQDLENKAAFETISKDLQVTLAKIEAEKQVRIAFAESMGEAMSAAKMTVWGDPSTVIKMSEAFFKGQQNGFFIDGLQEGLSEELKATLVGMGKKGAEIIEKLTGTKTAPEQANE